MSSQAFTAKQFSCLTRQGDYWSYFKNESGKGSKKVKEEFLQEVQSALDIENYSFQSLDSFKANGKTFFTLLKKPSDKANHIKIISDDFVLRKVNQNLKRIYKAKQADRFQIISTVKTLLANPAPFHVCQLDIKFFYESINRQKILSDINSSALVSYQTKNLLRKFFDGLPAAIKGLPRGIGLSATLSEYFMKKFDRQLGSMKSVYYYARFVDDIIIFSTEEITKKTINEIKGFLPKGLELNPNKKRICPLSSDLNKEIIITYLGYEFRCQLKSCPLKNKITREVKTRIAKKKLNKIKNRLVLAFLSFKAMPDFSLLKDRLLFLTATYPLKTQRKKLSKFEAAGILHGGILYSYPLIDDPECLSELDIFLNGLLRSKSLRRITATLNDAQRAEIKKFSFLQGYSRRISRKFPIDRIKIITECWR